jgi:signal transduction histidine kinase
LNELPKQKDDSNKVMLLGRLGRAHMMFNVRESIAYTEKGLKLAENIQWKKGMANLHNDLGLYLSDTGNHVLARVHFEKSYQLNKELDSKINQINNLNNIGRSYQRESNYTKAIENMLQSMAIAKELNNPEKIALVASNLSASFYAQKNFAKAQEYAEMCLKNGELANAQDHVGKALLNLGILRLEARDTVAAKEFLTRSYKTYTDLNNRTQMAAVLGSLSQLEYPDHKKMVAIMLEAQHIYDAISPAYVGSIANLANIGSAYYQLGLTSNSPEKEDYFKKAEETLARGADLCGQTNNKEFLATIMLSQADLAEAKGDYKTAFTHHKNATAINDSLYSQDKKNELAGMEGKYQLAIKDNEIAISKLQISNQRKTQLGLIAGIVLAGIIAVLLYRQSRSRKKTNTTLMVLNNQLDEANKVKARFFCILSHDLRSPIANLVQFLQLQKDEPGLLTDTQRASHQEKITQGAEDLLDNMEAILLWSKEQMKDFKPNIKVVAVSELFGHVQRFFAQAEKVDMVFSYEPGLTVMTDENYLQVIMQNLTANAIKALKNTPDASIEWAAVKEGDKTILSITDNGPGMRDEQVKALYEDNVAVNAKSGFGLHLVRDLARAIQYKISFQSQPGVGTTFILSA